MLDKNHPNRITSDQPGVGNAPYTLTGMPGANHQETVPGHSAAEGIRSLSAGQPDQHETITNPHDTAGRGTGSLSLDNQQDSPFHQQDSLIQQQDSPIHQQDSLIQQQDSLIHQQDSLIQQQNTLVHQPDTLVHQPDSLQQNAVPNRPDILQQQDPAVSRPDSLLNQSDIPVSDTTDRAGQNNQTETVSPGSRSADTVTGVGNEPVWDRIATRDREITLTTTVTARQQPEPAGSVQEIPESPHDASWYLDPDSDIPFFREHIFPVPAGIPRDNYRVFDGDVHELKTSAIAYKTYMESGTSENENGVDLHFSGTWIPGMIILSLLLLTWIKVAYVQFLTPVLVSIFNYKEAAKLYNNKNVPAQNAFRILHLVFALNSGLFLVFIAGHFNFRLPDLDPLLLFTAASAAVVLLFAIKGMALRITGYLFDTSRLFAEFSHNISIYNKIFGVLLTPVIVGLLYTDTSFHSTLIYTGLLLGGLFYLLQLVRGFEIIVRKEFSLFYSILYLCGFEILPIFILYRLFDSFLT